MFEAFAKAMADSPKKSMMNITTVSYVMVTILKTACKGITWDTWSVSHISEQEITY